MLYHWAIFPYGQKICLYKQVIPSVYTFVHVDEQTGIENKPYYASSMSLIK